MINCKKCWMKVDDENDRSAEMSIRLFRNNIQTEKVFEYIKLCPYCAEELLQQCGLTR